MRRIRLFGIAIAFVLSSLSFASLATADSLDYLSKGDPGGMTYVVNHTDAYVVPEIRPIRRDVVPFIIDPTFKVFNQPGQAWREATDVPYRLIDSGRRYA